MTVADRMTKYLSIVTKVNMDSRCKVVDMETGQFWPISTFEDLKETLILMERGASGVRPYLTMWFNDVFIPAFDSLEDKPNEDRDFNGNLLAIERYVGLNMKQLASKTKAVFGGPTLSSKDLLNKYVYPLINLGIINKAKSEMDGRQIICFPVEESGNIIFSLFEDPDDIRLKVSDIEIYPLKQLLEESFGSLSNYSSKAGVGRKYQLIDPEGHEITSSNLIDKYLCNPESCFKKDWYPSEQQAAVFKNIQYCEIQKKVLRPVWKNNLTEIHNSPMEEDYKYAYACRYCEFKTNDQEDYNYHTVMKHPRRAGY
jgi:hypothetical protein